MSIPEALKGAHAEIAAIKSPIEKTKRLLVYCRIIAAELLGTLQIIPYGVRALTLQRSLPEARLNQQKQQHQRGTTLSTARCLKYGALQRNTLDIYLPPETQSSPSTSLPVVLFCHGGIWATGESWHYAPMAVRLAQAGIITAVMQYSLYPTAKAPQMAEEVSSALTWTFDNIQSFGGDVNNISLVGHSAGAQLCAMALLHKACGSSGRRRINALQSIESPSLLQHDEQSRSCAAATRIESKSTAAPFEDSRMPRRFIGMAGVFDIAEHYEYEKDRDVHELSTMARAVGGPSCFASNSPSVILRVASGKKEARNNPKKKVWRGESLSTRIGLNRKSLSKNSSPHVDNFNKDNDNEEKQEEKATQQHHLSLSLEEVRRLPPTILQASTTDLTVPWYESADMHWALHDCGVPSKVLLYRNHVGHGDFVVNWRPLRRISTVPEKVSDDTSDLAPYAVDFVNIVKGGGEEAEGGEI